MYFGICLLINFHRHCWPSPFAISVKPNSRFPPSPYYGKCKKLSDICIFQMFQIFQMELSTRWRGNMFWNLRKTTFESPQPKWTTYLTIQRRKIIKKNYCLNNMRQKVCERVQSLLCHEHTHTNPPLSVSNGLRCRNMAGRWKSSRVGSCCFSNTFLYL